MQIACKRYGCQKAVEVCYWACKYRRDCKDWLGALNGQPGVAVITGQLQEADRKSGRVFDPQTMILTSRTKKNRAAIVSKSHSAHLKSGGFSMARGENLDVQCEPHKHKTIKTNFGEVKEKMTESNLDTPMAESVSATEAAAEAPTKTSAASAKAKPKPAAKPKPVSQSNGPVFLLLYPNGKYKELRESELTTEAADVLKDQSLRLVKGHHLIPQISFKTADE